MQLSEFIFFIAVIALGYASAVFVAGEGNGRCATQIVNEHQLPGDDLATFTGMDWRRSRAPVVFGGCDRRDHLRSLCHEQVFTAKMAESSRALLRFQSGIGNVVYVAIPLLNALFGSEYLYIIMIHSVVQDVSSGFSISPWWLGKRRFTQKRIREIVGNPAWSLSRSPSSFSWARCRFLPSLCRPLNDWRYCRTSRSSVSRFLIFHDSLPPKTY